VRRRLGIGGNAGAGAGTNAGTEVDTDAATDVSPTAGATGLRTGGMPLRTFCRAVRTPCEAGFCPERFGRGASGSKTRGEVEAVIFDMEKHLDWL
jgi:hypothetical protein